MVSAHAEFIRELTRSLLVLHPDRAFLSPRGELHVRTRALRVKRLRLQLPRRDLLHLHSIDLAGPLPIEPRRATTLTASSALEGRIPDPELLFDPDGVHDKAFHSLLEDRPWLDVEFRDPVELTRVTIRNAGSSTNRARGLGVLAYTEDGECKTLYDGTRREKELRRSIARMLRYRGEETDNGIAGMAAIVGSLILGDYADVAKKLTGLGLTPSEEALFRAQMNAQVLAPRELEWTSHGIRRSFRFWSAEEKRQYVRYTLEVVRDLRDLTEAVVFGFGSVLAAVRDGDLIAHDDDLDVLVAFDSREAPTLAAGIQLVHDHLTARNYRVTGEHVAHRWVQKEGVSKVDVFVGLFEGDTVAWYPGSRGSLTRQMMFPPSTGSLLGYGCPLPREPLQYLERVYGPSWRIPDPGFKHVWDRSKYADIAG
jgi:hypothetical protein